MNSPYTNIIVHTSNTYIYIYIRIHNMLYIRRSLVCLLLLVAFRESLVFIKGPQISPATGTCLLRGNNT